MSVFQEVDMSVVDFGWKIEVTMHESTSATSNEKRRTCPWLALVWDASSIGGGLLSLGSLPDDRPWADFFQHVSSLHGR